MCKFSFIIPVYNVEKYIKQCIDSIMSQNYNNFEIILIDDCSTDVSYKLCKQEENKNDRIKLYKNSKNIGLAGSRNEGLKKANGEWIVFVDSDDYINDQNFLYDLNKKITDEDMIFYGFTEFEDTNNIIIKKYPSEISYINCFNNSSEKINWLNINNKLSWSACSHAYKREFLINNNIKFDDTLRQAEDCEFFFKCMSYNPKFNAIDSFAYMYRRKRAGSLTENAIDTTRYAIQVTKNTIDTIKNSKLNIALKNSLYDVLAYNYITTFINIYRTMQGDELHDSIENLRPYMFINKYGKGTKLKFCQMLICFFGLHKGSYMIYKLHKITKKL